MSTEQTVAPPSPPAEAAPDDANDLRGFHFRLLLRKPLTWALTLVAAIADSKAEDTFFATYAAQRGLALSGKGPLPAATPLLRKGDARYAERALAGPLADGVDGVLALLHLRGGDHG